MGKYLLQQWGSVTVHRRGYHFHSISIYLEMEQQWERTQPITWSPTSTSQAKIAGVRVNNTATGGIEIATSNPTASGPIYASQHASNNWESIPVGNQRVFTILDEAGNPSVPGNLTINGSTISGNAINVLVDLFYPLGTLQGFSLESERTRFINNM